MKNDDVISTLNDLIETCKDGDEGFSTAAAHITDPSVRSLFENRAQSFCLIALHKTIGKRNLGSIL